MKLHIYLAFVKDSNNRPSAGVLLATDAVHAMRRAVDRCKATFGERSRVTKLTHIAEADAPTMERTQLLQVLSEFDQIAFAAVELEKLMQQTLKLMQQLTTYFETLQTKLNGE
jgi:hypothetical protein